MNPAEPSSNFRPGLNGVIATETHLSHVDGQNGNLVIAGYEADNLARHASFEEAAYLLWTGKRPTKEANISFRQSWKETTRSSWTTWSKIEPFIETFQGNIMESIRVYIASLQARDTLKPNKEQWIQDALSITSAFSVGTAAAWRKGQKQTPIPPDPNMDHVSNFLYMLQGEYPTPKAVDALKRYLLTVLDHGLNASTFTARVIAGTRSDLVSTALGAFGALKGPLHGGAPGPVLEMIQEIGTKDRAEPYLRNLLESGNRIMGFGHRIYRVRDPRADILAEAAETFYESENTSSDFYELAMHVERTALQLLAETKPDRSIKTNVEFYTALLLNGIGIPSQLFTPLFAVGRVVGWLAHVMEQLEDPRIIRPDSRYIGPFHGSWLKDSKEKR
ncbi:MAG: citrate synthase/methylcitrate synthase [Opitutaceae bacterium]|nr:citrate synthase/methylcitrate synthase [Opitutaceae bacterium]